MWAVSAHEDDCLQSGCGRDIEHTISEWPKDFIFGKIVAPRSQLSSLQHDADTGLAEALITDEKEYHGLWLTAPRPMPSSSLRYKPVAGWPPFLVR